VAPMAAARPSQLTSLLALVGIPRGLAREQPPWRQTMKASVKGIEAMRETARLQSGSHLPRITLNSDGHRHPLLNSLTAVTFVTGVAAFVIGLIVHLHLLATVVGMVSFVVGLCAQMFSATREQRIFIVGGLVAGFIGMGLGIAHGGFG
jgi:hypothetical protein